MSTPVSRDLDLFGRFSSICQAAYIASPRPTAHEQAEQLVQAAYLAPFSEQAVPQHIAWMDANPARHLECHDPEGVGKTRYRISDTKPFQLHDTITKAVEAAMIAKD